MNKSTFDPNDLSPREMAGATLGRLQKLLSDEGKKQKEAEHAVNMAVTFVANQLI